MKNEEELVEHLQKECEIWKLPFCGIEKEIKDFYKSLFNVVMRPPHEKKNIPEGVLFKKNSDEIQGAECILYNLETSTDGQRSFELKNGTDTEQTIVFENPLTQKDLLNLVPENEGDSAVIVKIENEVRVYYKRRISVLRVKNWSFTPKMSDIEKELSAVNPGAELKALMDIIEFAYFELSLDRIGATIVFFPSSDIPEGLFLDKKKKELDFDNKQERYLLKNYLKSHDGAIVIDRDKKVVYTSVFLKMEEETEEQGGENKTKRYPGSRRTAARYFSEDHPESYAITVSDDGPVHIFRKGQELETSEVVPNNEGIIIRAMNSRIPVRKIKNSQLKFEFGYNMLTSNVSENKAVSKETEPDTVEKEKNRKRLEGIYDMAERMDEIVDTDHVSGKCPKCGKEYNLVVVRVSGFNDREEFCCDNCHTKLLSRSCFDILSI